MTASLTDPPVNVVPAGDCFQCGANGAYHFEGVSRHNKTGWAFRCARGNYWTVARTRTDILGFLAKAMLARPEAT